MMDSLNVPQTVFCLFYAIFWGLVANAQISWKAFDWPLALAGRADPTYRQSWNRLGRSMEYLVILPIALFLILVAILASLPKQDHFGFRAIAQMFCAVLAAQAAFAPYRLWLSRIERSPGKFYYLHLEKHSDPRKPKYSAQPNGELELLLDPNWSRSNRKVAWGYIIISIAIAAIGYALG
jgi:hypothetical protein